MLQNLASPEFLKGFALLFFVSFWLVVVFRLALRSRDLDRACAQIPLDEDVTTPRTSARSTARPEPRTQS